MDTKITPLPWRVGTDSEADIFSPGNELLAMSFPMNVGGNKVARDNAAFIVKAVNTHDMLVTALRDLEVSANSLQYCFDHRPENFGVALTQLAADAKRAREALAAAEGK